MWWKIILFSICVITLLYFIGCETFHDSSFYNVLDDEYDNYYTIPNWGHQVYLGSKLDSVGIRTEAFSEYQSESVEFVSGLLDICGQEIPLENAVLRCVLEERSDWVWNPKDFPYQYVGDRSLKEVYEHLKRGEKLYTIWIYYEMTLEKREGYAILRNYKKNKRAVLTLKHRILLENGETVEREFNSEYRVSISKRREPNAFGDTIQTILIAPLVWIFGISW